MGHLLKNPYKDEYKLDLLKKIIFQALATTFHMIRLNASPLMLRNMKAGMLALAMAQRQQSLHGQSMTIKVRVQ